MSLKPLLAINSPGSQHSCHPEAFCTQPSTKACWLSAKRAVQLLPCSRHEPYKRKASGQIAAHQSRPAQIELPIILPASVLHAWTPRSPWLRSLAQVHSRPHMHILKTGPNISQSSDAMEVVYIHGCVLKLQQTLLLMPHCLGPKPQTSPAIAAMPSMAESPGWVSVHQLSLQRGQLLGSLLLHQGAFLVEPAGKAGCASCCTVRLPERSALAALSMPAENVLRVEHIRHLQHPDPVS